MNPPPNAKTRRHAFLLAVSLTAVTLLSLLAACGGGGDAPADPAATAAAGGTLTAAPPAVTGTATTPATPPTAGTVALDAASSCGIANFQTVMLQQINAARAAARSCGTTAYPATTALAWDAQLFSAAAKHSADMAQNNYFLHTGQDGRSPADRVSAEGYAWRSTGENIAAGYNGIDSVMAGWLASPGHCANIMRASYADVAVACVQRAGSTYGTYWTMELGRR